MAPLRRLPEKDHVEDEKNEEVDRIGELRDALAMYPSLAFDYMGGNGSLSRHYNMSHSVQKVLIAQLYWYCK